MYFFAYRWRDYAQNIPEYIARMNQLKTYDSHTIPPVWPEFTPHHNVQYGGVCETPAAGGRCANISQIYTTYKFTAKYRYFQSISQKWREKRVFVSISFR